MILYREKGIFLYYLWLLLSVGLVGIDRLTKFLVTSNMNISDTIHLIKIGDTEVLNLYYCLNSGAAFSRLSGKTVFLIVITSAVIIGLLFLIITKRVHRTVYLVSISLILGGGIGNLIDRIFNDGKVIDFIDFRIINFAVFNFADICAVCGASLLMITVVVDEIKEHKRKKTAVPAGESEEDEFDGDEETDADDE